MKMPVPIFLVFLFSYSCIPSLAADNVSPTSPFDYPWSQIKTELGKSLNCEWEGESPQTAGCIARRRLLDGKEFRVIVSFEMNDGHLTEVSVVFDPELPEAKTAVRLMGYFFPDLKSNKKWIEGAIALSKFSASRSMIHVGDKYALVQWHQFADLDRDLAVLVITKGWPFDQWKFLEER